MTADPYFADYRPEQCQQDLTTLTEWKNLSTLQDTRKVSTIEEFKNIKFRYQMSQYSVEQFPAMAPEGATQVYT